MSVKIKTRASDDEVVTFEHDLVDKVLAFRDFLFDLYGRAQVYCFTIDPKRDRVLVRFLVSRERLYGNYGNGSTPSYIREKLEILLTEIAGFKVTVSAYLTTQRVRDHEGRLASYSRVEFTITPEFESLPDKKTPHALRVY